METVRRHLALLDGPGRAIEIAVLIPKDDLPAVLDELRAVLAPCGNAQARPLARRIAAQYPTFRAEEAWLDGVASALGKAPADIAKRIAAQIPQDHEWPPSVGVVVAELRRQTGRRHAMLARAEAMLAEHDRREAEAAERARIAAEKRDLLARMAGRHPLEFFPGGGENGE